MPELPDTNRRTALKFVGSTAVATSVPVLASSPGAAEAADDGPAFREWIPAAGELGDSDELEYVYLDLDQIRANRQQRTDDGLSSYLDADSDSPLDSLPAIIRIPLNITLSLTISSLGILFFGNIISVGWDADDSSPDLSSSTMLWVNGVTIIDGDFGASEAIEAIREERDGYEAVGSKDGFELYEREYDGLFDTFGRDGRAFAAKDDTLVVCQREDGLDRIEAGMVEKFSGDRLSQHEQDEQFDWATRETSDAAIASGSVNSDDVRGVSLRDELSDLADARVLTAGVEVDGWNTDGLLKAGFDGAAPDEWAVEDSIEDSSDLSISSSGDLVSVTDQYE